MARLDRRVAVDDWLVILGYPSGQTLSHWDLERGEECCIRTGDMHWDQAIASAFVNRDGVMRHDGAQAGSQQRKGLVQTQRIPEFLDQFEQHLGFLPGAG